MTLGAGCARARATSSASGTPNNRSRRSSTDHLPLEAAVAGRARRSAGLSGATGGWRTGAALGDFGIALRALVLLLRLGALLLDPADAAVPVCAHVLAPATLRQPEVVPPAPRRCSLAPPSTITTTTTRRSSPSRSWRSTRAMAGRCGHGPRS